MSATTERWTSTREMRTRGSAKAGRCRDWGAGRGGRLLRPRARRSTRKSWGWISKGDALSDRGRRKTRSVAMTRHWRSTPDARLRGSTRAGAVGARAHGGGHCLLRPGARDRPEMCRCVEQQGHCAGGPGAQGRRRRRFDRALEIDPAAGTARALCWPAWGGCRTP